MEILVDRGSSIFRSFVRSFVRSLVFILRAALVEKKMTRGGGRRRRKYYALTFITVFIIIKVYSCILETRTEYVYVASHAEKPRGFSTLRLEA